MLVLENGIAQRRHHDANCPARVALELDDLVRTVNSSSQLVSNHSRRACRHGTSVFSGECRYNSHHLDTIGRSFSHLLESDH